MSNTVEFILKLKDLMSGSMQKVQAVTQSSFGAVDRTIGRTQGMLNNLGKRTKINVDTSQLGKANQEVQSLSDRLRNLARNSGGGVGIGGMLAGLGLGAAGANVLNSGMEGQKNLASFEVLAGQKNGAKLYQDITKFAQDSIFGNELYKNAQTMLAFGIGDGEVMRNLKMLGDVSMGDKEKLGSLTLAFSQMRATGRLMGQDLLQMINAGFNPLQVISEKTGVSLGDLKKQMEKGSISADMVTNAFIAATSQGGKFYNMTEKIAQTDFGKWEAFKGQVQGLALQVGGKLAPAFGNLLTKYGVPFLEWVSRSVEWVQKNWNWLKHLAGMVLTVAAAVKTFAIAQGILNVVMMANPVMLIVGGIGLLVYWLIQAYNSTESFRNMVDGLFGSLKSLGRILGALITDIASFIGTANQADFAAAGEAHAKAYSSSFTATLLTEVSVGLASLYAKIKKSDLFGSYTKEHVDRSAEFKRPTSSIWNASSLVKKWRDAPPALARTAAVNAFGGAQETSDKINGGGVRSITINVGKFFDDFVIHTQNMTEGIEQLEDRVIEALHRTLNSGNAIQGN